MKTFCIAIGQPLVVARCPLPCGACAWQHRDTNFCKYTDQEITIEEHATLIGVDVPTTQEQQALELKLIASIRAQV